MKKIYLSILAIAFSATAMAQTVAIGSDLTTPGGSNFRSPWSPLYEYSFVQTIYLQSEINTAGNITQLRYNYSGSSLANSDNVTVWMGTVSRGAFASTTDWEPVANLTKVFEGAVSFGSLPGTVTINLTTPFNYTNAGNLIIAIDEDVPGFSTGTSFYTSDMGTGNTRTIYFNDDGAANNPDPANPPVADGIRTRVGNIQIVFGAAQPVTLAAFSGEASGSTNKLSWSTQTEQNNKGFELQRSADGASFSTVAFVKTNAPAGNSTSNLAYNYTDAKPLAGTNYYRLKQVDFDGKATISKVVAIKGTASKASLSVAYPNPTKKEVNVILASPRADKATIYISDISGRIVYTATHGLQVGDTKILVDASAFAKGVYTIKALYAAGKESLVSRFVKQ